MNLMTSTLFATGATALLLAMPPSDQNGGWLPLSEASLAATFDAGVEKVILLTADKGKEKKASRSEADESRREKDEEMYTRGTDALDAGRWTAAIAAFRSVSKKGGSRADKALYWLAFAQNKSGRAAEALSTLGELRERYPSSKWNTEAKGLELEIRQSSGQQVSPEQVNDEDLKLIAITSLMTGDPERAVTLLEKILQKPSSAALEERALFVLTQSSSPRAAKLIESIARGTSGKKLQIEALRLLGTSGSNAHRTLLAEVYRGSSDRDVKQSVLQGLMISGDKAKILQVASGDRDPQLRGEAARLLGTMGATAELARLYSTEASVEVKENIIQGMFIAADAGKLAELARTEPNDGLRSTAIRNLGLFPTERSGSLLVELYRKDSSRAAKEAAMEGLFIQGNARALVGLARGEKDRSMKKSILEKLAHIDSREATEYMLELLEQ